MRGKASTLNRSGQRGVRRFASGPTVTLCVLALGAWGVAVPSAWAARTGRPTGPTVRFGVPNSAFAAASSPFALTGVEALTGIAIAQAAEEAKLASPQATAAREESRARFVGLGPNAAAALASKAFPETIDQPSGGPPTLPPGESITGYSADNVAQVLLPGSGHAVIDSGAPLAVKTASGGYQPIDLSLRGRAGSFAPALSAAGVRIGGRVGEGATLASLGVSLSPVSKNGRPLQAARGKIDGDAVFYGSSATDMDTAIKPTSTGFEEDDFLRSPSAPATVYYELGLPAGAAASQPSESGPVRITEDGREVAIILPPDARDAAGSDVPVSMSLTDDTLRLSVGDQTGDYTFPIAVDPKVEEAEDKQLVTEGSRESNWVHSATQEGFHFCETCESNHLEELYEGKHGEGSAWTAYEAYDTQGSSHIYSAVANLYSTVIPFQSESQHQNYWALHNFTGQAEGTPLSVNGYFNAAREELCAPPATPPSCNAADGSRENSVQFLHEFVKEGSDGMRTLLWEPTVFINAPEQPSTPAFDASDELLHINAGGQATSETFSNAAPGAPAPGGARKWTGPASGSALGIETVDKGIGVYKVRASSPEEYTQGEERNPYHEWGSPTSGCFGVQCVQAWQSPGATPAAVERAEGAPLNVPLFTTVKCGAGACRHSWLREGQDTVKVEVENATGTPVASKEETIYVEETSPSGPTLQGLPGGGEIGEGIYRLHAEASEARSGIVSTGLSVDGRPVSSSGGSCQGSCKASAQFTLNGALYTPGEHRMILTATNGAGNVASQEYVLKVHAASPVSAGPGAVNPESGNLQLSASDVSLGGGLELTRTYNSRSTTAGAGGAFGAPWTTSLTGIESVGELENGAMLLTDATGQRVAFQPTVKPPGLVTPQLARETTERFVSPAGDQNVTLEKVMGEGGVAEAVLEDPTAGTKTRFALAKNSGYPTPAYTGRLGAQGEGQLGQPQGVAVAPSGDVWVTDYAKDRIEEFTPEGTLLRIVGTKGTGNAQFEDPWGVAVNESTGNVYVTDSGNHRVEEFSQNGSFIRAFSKYVRYEIPTTYENLQAPEGIAIDSQGNVWVADTQANKVIRFDGEGVSSELYERNRIEGAGFSSPSGVAVEGDTVFVADSGNNRIAEFSTEGLLQSEGQFGSAGSGPGQLSDPQGLTANPETGDLYVADTGNSRVQEFSPQGTFVTKFGAAGSSLAALSAPHGLGVSPEGVLYIADSGNDRLEAWQKPLALATWLPVHSEGPQPSETRSYAWEALEVEGVSVTEPTLVVGPEVGGIHCFNSKHELALEDGCRALKFKYGAPGGSNKGATGENASEWGEYKGRLNKVLLDAWEHGHTSASEITVAQYEYDKQGRLRAEWDPEISPALKTTYGYDEQGHVTALASPGQQPWVFSYGTLAGDPSAGRLVKTMRPGASTPLPTGVAIQSTALPTLSGVPLVGERMAVSRGSWSGQAPDVYSFQWEDCNAQGEECEAIQGANNQNYTPRESDLGHTLRVTVTATGPQGSALAQSAPSSLLEPARALESPAAPISASANVEAGKEVTLNLPQSATFASAPITVQGQSGETATFAVGDTAAFKARSSGGYEATGRGIVLEAEGWGQLEHPFVEFGPLAVTCTPPPGALMATVPISQASSSLKSYAASFTAECMLAPGILSVRWPAKITLSAKGPESVAPGQQVKLSEASVAISFPRTGPGASSTWGLIYNFGVRKLAATLTNLEVSQVAGQAGSAEAPPQPAQPGETIEYGVPVQGQGAPYAMGAGEVAAWGQSDLPAEATAIFPPDEPQGYPASDYRRASLYYLDAKGHQVNVASPGGGISTSEYNAENEPVRSLSADDRALALKAGSASVEVAQHLSTTSTYKGERAGEQGASEPGSELLETLGPEHTVKLQSKLGSREAGAEVKARAHTVYYYNEAAPATGGPYRLATRVAQGALLPTGEEGDVRETATSYSGTGAEEANVGWRLREPTQTTTEPSGLKVKHAVVYGEKPEDAGQVIETREPAGQSGGSARDERTIYYSASANAEDVSACANHPEWAGLPCETLPAAQPSGSGAPPAPPPLPTTITTYNIYDEPTKVEELFGSTTRTKTTTYEAGRVASGEIKGGSGQPQPKVVDRYSPASGALVEEASEGPNSTGPIISDYNTLGELESYTDANGITSSYAYDEDGRLKSLDDGKGTQAIQYSETTGLPIQLTDSAFSSPFTASYDSEGKLLTEGYPGGITAFYSYNEADEPISLEYKKMTDCSTTCTWYTDAVAPSIHGQWLEQATAFPKEPAKARTLHYTYDGEQRLTQVQDETSKGCTTRLYEYDQEGNRTGLQTTMPETGHKCSSEGGGVETHSYDEANRLVDAGTAYNAMGDITSLPAEDGGGSPLTSEFFVGNQVQSQTQEEQTIGYQLDPSGRASKILSTGTIAASEEQQYAGPGSSPSWTGELNGQSYTRMITGLRGGLVAIQHNTGQPELELPDLHGDIAAKASSSETASGLEATAEESEFGIPATEAPGKYAWLGFNGLRTELPSGVIAMGARSYAPGLGRFLQPDPVEGGSINAYAYTVDDPVNSVDLTGTRTGAGDAADQNFAATYASERQEAMLLQLIREEAQRRQAEGQAALAAAEAQLILESAEEAGYEQAEELAFAGGAGETATIAKSRAHVYVGCVEVVAFILCSGSSGGKTGRGKVPSNYHGPTNNVPTGVRAASGVTGAAVAIRGALGAVACTLAAAASPEDGGFPFIPLELHCVANSGAAILAGGAMVVTSIFG